MRANRSDRLTQCERRAPLVGLIGSAMEWYDFAVFGYFAAVIGPQFFPTDDPRLSLAAAFGVFALGFFVRPLGGLVFGRIGDRFGRERVMSLSILMMALPTLLMALLPTQAMVGAWAPVLLVTLRILQGLSVCGEYASSSVYLSESGTPERRARRMIWVVWGAVAGSLLGVGAGASMALLFDASSLSQWGWRLPFVFGAILAVAGYLLRRDLKSEEPASASHITLKQTWSVHRGQVLRVALLNSSLGVAVFTLVAYGANFIDAFVQLPVAIALPINLASLALLLLLLPLGARLSDHFGRRPLVMAGNALLVAGAIPFFQLLHSGDPWLMFLGESGFAVAIALMAGGLVAANVELLPTALRCTGLGLGANLAVGVFGGLTPLVAAWLVAVTGNSLAPAFWVLSAAGLALVTAAAWMPETLPRRSSVTSAQRVSIDAYATPLAGTMRLRSLPEVRSATGSEFTLSLNRASTRHWGG